MNVTFAEYKQMQCSALLDCALDSVLDAENGTEEVDALNPQDSKAWSLIRARVMEDCAGELNACRDVQEVYVLRERWSRLEDWHHTQGNCPLKGAFRSAMLRASAIIDWGLCS